MDHHYISLRKWTLLILLAGAFLPGLSQPYAFRDEQTGRFKQNLKTQKEELQRISSEFTNRWNEKKLEAEAFAKKNNLKIRQEFPNGKVIQLVAVEDGFPLYYTTHNAGAATTTRADKLWSGGSLGINIDGTGLQGALGVWDAGAVLTNHQEFNNTGYPRVTQEDGAPTLSSHSTHVAGTMVAGGVTAKAKGMAPKGTLKAYDWDNDDAEMAAAASAGMLVSSHSYGFTYGWDSNGNWYGNPTVSKTEDYRFGFYSSYTRDWDKIAYNAPYYLIVKSAGNDRNDKAPAGGQYPDDGYPDGFDCIGTDAIGKNILTVGAIYQVSNYTKPSDVMMTSLSAWGPADDGRIKPDIVGKGALVYSSVSTSPTSYTSMNGTSMATPNVAGTAALLQEYYMQMNGSPMLASTLKALIIHTADEAGPADGPDYMFGWGLFNAEKAARLIKKDALEANIIDEQQLVNGGTYTVNVQATGTEPLAATIVWTDPAGNALPASLDPSTPALVNDLDITIKGNGKVYFPWKLDKNNPSAAATQNSKNYVDNVEKVYIANPAAGSYTITVAHDGTLAKAQTFSLIISGGAPVTAKAPVAEFTASKTTVTAGENVQFTNTSLNAPTTFQWTFDGGTPATSTLENPAVVYNTPGTYSVTLKATNASGSDTEIKSGLITVKVAVPVAEFTADRTSLTKGESVQFSDLSQNATSYAWTFQGGTPASSTQKNPVVTYAAEGTYSVTLVATNASGSDTKIKSGLITVKVAAPVAEFTADRTTLTKGESVQFSDLSQNATSYAWTFQGGIPASSTQKNPVVTYTAEGTYSVTLVATNASGSDTKTKTGLITVKVAAPVAEFTADRTTLTKGESVQFSDLSQNATSYAWTFQGGTPASSTQKNPVVTYAAEGTYSVTLVATNASGSDTEIKSGLITVKTQPVIAEFTADKNMILENEAVAFSDRSSNNPTSWSWSFPGGSPAVSNEQNPKVSYKTSGIYDVKLKVANPNGSDSIVKSRFITVKMAAPVADFTVDRNLLTNGESVQFTDLSQNAVSYTWTFQGGTPATSTEKNPLVAYAAEGTYAVTLTVTNPDGSDTETKTGLITVRMTAPVAEFTADRISLLKNEPVQFTDLSTYAVSYAWTFDGGTPAASTEKNPKVVYPTAGVYSVTLTVTNSGGTDTEVKTGLITVANPETAEKTAPYCTATALNSTLEWISMVSVGSFTNRSAAAGYSDFTDLSVDLRTGSNYQVQLTPGYNGVKSPVYWRVWIDLNGDSDFDDPGELILSANKMKGNVNGKIHIPANITLTTTRMRVAMKNGSAPGPCETFERGEVEDYTVNLFTNKSEMITTPTSLDPQPALSAYPNPARDYINVRLTNWTQPVEIRLTDLAGRTIFSQKTADNAISLNVAGYNKGIYLMEVTDGASRAFQKVIIH